MNSLNNQMMSKKSFDLSNDIDFSVVIPLYNKSHTIVRTLRSVLKQTYKEFEIIIVNDGSTDNSLEVIKAFTSDIRLRIVEQHNQGVSAARNKGVLLANYDYIAFLDGDDEWLPEYLEKMKQAVDLYPQSGMFCCAGAYKENSDEILSYRIARKYQDKITKINYFENPHVFTHTSATIVHKKEFHKCGGFPIGMRKNEDFALFYSLALITTVVYCGFPLACYYGEVEGQATSLTVDNNKLELDIINRFNLVHKTWEISGKKNKVYMIWLQYEVRHLFIGALRDNNYELIKLVLNNLDQGIKECFYDLEFTLIKKERYNKVALLYIMFTKIVWRIHGYPRVGSV